MGPWFGAYELTLLAEAIEGGQDFPRQVTFCRFARQAASPKSPTNHPAPESQSEQAPELPVRLAGLCSPPGNQGAQLHTGSDQSRSLLTMGQ
jgi:hypothetical protein